MRESTVFSLFVSSHFDGGYLPSQVRTSRGVTHPSQWGIPSFPMGGTPSFLTHGGTAIRTDGVPSHQDWMGIPPRDWMGVPQVRTGWGYPSNVRTGWGTPIRKQSGHLLRSGRYASCIHAVGLSGCNHILGNEN